MTPERALLCGVLAVQVGFATPQQAMAAASAYVVDPQRSVLERLLADGVLNAERFAMLNAMVEQAIMAHGGDAKKTLNTLGGQRAVYASLGASLEVDAQGEFSLAARSTGADGGMEDPTAVQPEAPGRYRFVGGELGRGGIGRVLIAFDEFLGREIAVKELLGDAGDATITQPGSGSVSRTSAAVARFLQEARVTGQLEHPNIVPVYEVGQRANGALYYTMKLVRGRTLALALKECGTLADRLKLLGHYLDLCHAVAYAHSRGVVHRDIKTENVMLGEFGETVVLDWGLAKVKGKKDIRGGEIAREVKILHDAQTGHTVHGSAIGTPAYMSPEQAEGLIDEIDERSDIWSLGAVLYEILTGRPPFEGVTPYEIVGKVLKDDVAPVRQTDPDAPVELAAVAHKALTRDKGRRYQKAGDLAKEVHVYMTGGRIQAYDYNAWELIKRFAARNKALSIGVAAVALTVVLAAILIFMAYGREQLARQTAEEQRRSAASHLAQAYLNKAEQLGRDRNYNAGYLYATAALREYQRLGGVPAEKRAALDSALYENKIRRALTFEGTLPGPKSEVTRIALSPDGRLLATADAGLEIQVLPLDGSKPAVSRVAPSYPYSLAFSEDGKQLYVGTFMDVSVYDSESLAENGVEPIEAVVLFHPQKARRVLVYKESGIEFAEIGSDKPRILLGPAVAFSWSRDGALFARCAPDGEVFLYDGVAGTLKERFRLGPEPLNYCELSADASRLLISRIGGMESVDLASKRVVRLASGLIGSRSVMPSPVGAGWMVGYDRGVMIWDGLGSNIGERLWQSEQGILAETTRDGRRVVMVQKGVTRVWRVRTTERGTSLNAEGAPLMATFSPDGARVAFGTLNGLIQLADLAAGTAPVIIAKHAPSICTNASFSPDGRQIVTSGFDRQVRLFDVATSAELKSRLLDRLEWLDNHCSQARFSPDGAHIAVTAADGRVRLLDAKTLELERILQHSLPWPRTLRFSPDGRLLVGAGKWGIVDWWDTATWRFVRYTEIEKAGDLSDVVVSADGKTILTAGLDGWIRRVAVDTGETLGGWPAHGVWANALALSPDGKFLLTGSDDYTAKLWDTSTWELVRTLHSDAQVGAVAFSPDGTAFIMGDQSSLKLMPDLRGLLDGDGERLHAEAVSDSGLALVGFDMIALGEAPPEVPPLEPSMPPREPGEMHGHVESWAYPDKIVPEGTVLELLDLAHRPFNPPVLARTDKIGNVSFLLPDDVDRYVARVEINGESSYLAMPRYRRGVVDRIVFRVAGAKEVAYFASQAGVKLAPGMGVLMGSVYWGDPKDYGRSTSVGCVSVTMDGGVAPLFSLPTSRSLVGLDARMKVQHPGAPFFYFFNVPPGEHVITARLGDTVVEERTVLHAGCLTRIGLNFPLDRYPEDPTPPDCLANWPPTE